MQLNWTKCQGEVWCKLDTVNLSHEHFRNREGVYIIWHGGTSAWTVLVGSGPIAERLTRHRTDPQVQAYANLGLYVTWATVLESNREGVVRFLFERLKPKVPSHFQNIPPVEVNLPW